MTFPVMLGIWSIIVFWVACLICYLLRDTWLLFPFGVTMAIVWAMGLAILVDMDVKNVL